jgi:hypothetical protein
MLVRRPSMSVGREIHPRLQRRDTPPARRPLAALALLAVAGLLGGFGIGRVTLGGSGAAPVTTQVMPIDAGTAPPAVRRGPARATEPEAGVPALPSR